MINDETNPDKLNSDDHAERVRNSFNEWRGTVRDRIQPQDEEHINNIEDAVLVRDTERARKHLEATKINSGWIQEELMKHPIISEVMRELAIFGL